MGFEGVVGVKTVQSTFKLEKLSSLVEINIGKTPARKENSYWRGEYPWVAISDLKGDKYIEFTKEGITSEGILNSKIKIVPENTILFSYKLSIGKVAITKNPIYTNEAIAAFPILDTEKVEQDYLYYVLREFDFSDGGDRAVMGKTLNKAKLKELKIPLPPLAEQQKIAEILDAADALRHKDQQLIDHYTTLSQSLFLEMFGDPVTNPMGWDAIHLNNVIHVKHGFAFRSEFFSNEGAYVLLTPGNFDAEGGYRDQGMKQKYYTGDFPNEYLLKQNDLLLAMTEQAVGLLGCPLFVPNNEMFLHNQRLGLVEIIGAVNRVYLFSLFNSSVIRQLIHIKATGTKVRHTSPTKIKEIKVGIPPLELQNQFANHIANIEKQKQQAQASLVQSNNLFNSLLQKVFTGELTA